MRLLLDEVALALSTRITPHVTMRLSRGFLGWLSSHLCFHPTGNGIIGALLRDQGGGRWWVSSYSLKSMNSDARLLALWLLEVPLV